MRQLNIGGRLLDLDRPLVMGILNITPDSFYSGSRFSRTGKILDHVENMLQDGADIIDVGAFTSRPGANLITEEEELSRLIPVVPEIFNRFPDINLSIDTYRSGVINKLSEFGSFIVNDISGFAYDKDLPAAVAKLSLPYVLMHMRGTPENMKNQAQYEDVSLEVLKYFKEKLYVLNDAGVHQVIVDPGFGFAKNIAQNFSMLQKLNVFKVAGCPLLVGISRKSMIYKTLGITVEQALNGTTALHMAALLNGADILRVHDVKEAVETVSLFSKLETDVND